MIIAIRRKRVYWKWAGGGERWAVKMIFDRYNGVPAHSRLYLKHNHFLAARAALRRLSPHLRIIPL